MIKEGTRRFDLYDFFSVLLPGAAFVIGLLPFLPQELPIFTPVMVAFLIIWGFVFGRALHVVGVAVDDFNGLTILGKDIYTGSVSTGHRDRFIKELLAPEYVTKHLATQFYAVSRNEFPELELPLYRRDLDQDENETDLKMLYGLVRSYIHMDSRGRSRTFQAVLDFYRTMMVTALLLAAIYFSYAIVSGIAPFSGTTLGVLVGYQSHLGAISPQPGAIAFVSIIFFIGPYFAFKKARPPYRGYYIQYLMSDFLILQNQFSDKY